MAIYDLWLSRNNGPTVSNYVGHANKLFYDPAERVLRISDGSTVGGTVFNGIVTVASTAPTTTFQGQLWLNPQTYDLRVYHNNAFVPTINVATTTNLGGVKLGPGVTTNGSGQIIIDSTGLDFSFGDIASTIGNYTDNSRYAVLQTINLNEDLVLASNGTGGIHVVGEFRINRTNGNLTSTLEAVPVFEIKADGQVKLLVPTIDSTEGAVSIVGSSTGAFISPVNTGVMLHVTGQYDTPAVPSRIYNDSQNTFASFVARRFNGTVASPTAVLADEEIMRISGTSHNGTTIPGTGQARIVYKALGNQTVSNQGGYIELWAVPLNSTTIAKIATINNADGITATKFTGPLTGNVTGKADTAGNADTVTNGVYTNGSYANPAWITSLAASKVGLGSVENTALSTWAGSSNITTAGTLTTTSVSDSIGNLRSIPINNKVAGYILASTDSGQMISITTGGVTVNSGVFASPYGQTVSIYNNSASSQTITQGAGVTLRLAGTTATGNRTLARYGVATIVCVAANTFVMSGAGVS